jgi:hypothetical protein
MDATMETARMTKYYRGDFAGLLGRKIVDIRAMYPEEMELFMWHGEPGGVVQLDDVGLFIPMQDPEGNGPGHLMIQEGSK